MFKLAAFSSFKDFVVVTNFHKFVLQNNKFYFTKIKELKFWKVKLTKKRFKLIASLDFTITSQKLFCPVRIVGSFVSAVCSILCSVLSTAQLDSGLNQPNRHWALTVTRVLHSNDVSTSLWSSSISFCTAFALLRLSVCVCFPWLLFVSRLNLRRSERCSCLFYEIVFFFTDFLRTVSRLTVNVPADKTVGYSRSIRLVTTKSVLTLPKLSATKLSAKEK